jgi:tRNA(Ile)-lysidine synthase TilS/MesJ
MQRGTGRQGLTPMNTPDIMRPLLNTTKAEIIAYAHEHNVRWHEDSTNASSDYARNVVRKKLQANLTTQNRKRIIAIHAESLQRNAEIDDLLMSVLAYVQDENDAIVRARFVTLPYAVCCELMMLWLKNNGIYDYDRKKITSLVIAVKTLLIGKKVDINNAYWLVSEKTSIKILRK